MARSCLVLLYLSLELNWKLTGIQWYYLITSKTKKDLPFVQLIDFLMDYELMKLGSDAKRSLLSGLVDDVQVCLNSFQLNLACFKFLLLMSQMDRWVCRVNILRIFGKMITIGNLKSESSHHPSSSSSSSNSSSSSISTQVTETQESRCTYQSCIKEAYWNCSSCPKLFYCDDCWEKYHSSRPNLPSFKRNHLEKRSKIGPKLDFRNFSDEEKQKDVKNRICVSTKHGIQLGSKYYALHEMLGVITKKPLSLFVVSFIGPTAVGKSQLIRQMITGNVRPLPAPPNSTKPMSTDINAFWMNLATGPSSPLLLDSEGTDGNETQTSDKSLEERGATHQQYGSLLYLYSNVICFVYKADMRQFKVILTRLLESSKYAVTGLVGTKKPHLIIIFNQLGKKEMQSREKLDTQMQNRKKIGELERYYRTVEVVQIPYFDSARAQSEYDQFMEHIDSLKLKILQYQQEVNVVNPKTLLPLKQVVRHFNLKDGTAFNAMTNQDNNNKENAKRLYLQQRLIECFNHVYRLIDTVALQQELQEEIERQQLSNTQDSRTNNPYSSSLFIKHRINRTIALMQTLIVNLIALFRSRDEQQQKSTSEASNQHFKQADLKEWKLACEALDEHVQSLIPCKASTNYDGTEYRCQHSEYTHCDQDHQHVVKRTVSNSFVAFFKYMFNHKSNGYTHRWKGGMQRPADFELLKFADTNLGSEIVELMELKRAESTYLDNTFQIRRILMQECNLVTANIGYSSNILNYDLPPSQKLNELICSRCIIGTPVRDKQCGHYVCVDCSKFDDVTTKCKFCNKLNQASIKRLQPHTIQEAKVEMKTYMSDILGKKSKKQCTETFKFRFNLKPRTLVLRGSDDIDGLLFMFECVHKQTGLYPRDYFDEMIGFSGDNHAELLFSLASGGLSMTLPRERRVSDLIGEVKVKLMTDCEGKVDYVHFDPQKSLVNALSMMKAKSQSQDLEIVGNVIFNKESHECFSFESAAMLKVDLDHHSNRNIDEIPMMETLIDHSGLAYSCSQVGYWPTHVPPDMYLSVDTFGLVDSASLQPLINQLLASCFFVVQEDTKTGIRCWIGLRVSLHPKTMELLETQINSASNGKLEPESWPFRVMGIENDIKQTMMSCFSSGSLAKCANVICAIDTKVKNENDKDNILVKCFGLESADKMIGVSRESNNIMIVEQVLPQSDWEDVENILLSNRSCPE